MPGVPASLLDLGFHSAFCEATNLVNHRHVRRDPPIDEGAGPPQAGGVTAQITDLLTRGKVLARRPPEPCQEYLPKVLAIPGKYRGLNCLREQEN